MSILRRHMSLAFAAPLTAGVLLAAPAFSHCDTLDGPVVADARIALEAEDVTPTLKWIPADDEEEIREAFDMAVAARGASEEAQQVADRFFFETLVRVHRASEGAPFTGLKPADSVDPGIAAADQALEDGNIDELSERISTMVQEELESRFAEAYERIQTKDESVEQGREFVLSYVEFTHFVEGVEHIMSEGVDHLVTHGVGDEAHSH